MKAPGRPCYVGIWGTGEARGAGAFGPWADGAWPGQTRAGHIHRQPFVIFGQHAFRTCSIPALQFLRCLANHCDRNAWEKRETRRLAGADDEGRDGGQILLCVVIINCRPCVASLQKYTDTGLPKGNEMIDTLGIKRAVIVRDKLPEQFPTHRHSAQFWEQLGRTIATFGFLEEVLGKAIFAFTATRRYSDQEIETAYEAFLPKLQKALTDQLWNLAESYEKAVRDNPDSTIENIAELVKDIKEATNIRNVLCHGSWREPDESGKSLPLFVNKKNEIFETPVDTAYLKSVQFHIAGLVCDIIDTVTHMGWQFPGGAGPGKRVWG